MSSAAGTLVFPSVEWFQALQQLVNVDPEFRRLGSIDAAMGVKVGSRVFVVVFEAFECTEVRDGSEADLDDLDFYLELSEADWRELVENTKANGGADRRHTLNTLDLTANDGLAQNATGDQLRGDIFFRVNESLQYFFDQAAKLETVFE
ncbi:MAG: hypothetical protein FI715_10880 [SAR202 cluster bacterium]|uniref:Uncharacterized protein n=2 Tax=ecological metagenomes TaxID=410657 RepID=A0A160V9V9_9ZZZZ|nr:hypothetical protein [Dehalococcoidia bacterium]MEC9288967.1 hypothetical protein [Chloroflexota bacterium]MQF92336.1 hypothetical protein [SAR202 cluster bacterium]MCH2500041.1 hypothetical protein [Dehalococcoidia bacterium]MEE3166185.1 hypothetical protein [Chloroflexota bacterium]|tara:strand:+ start:482 stop:928 length:447 start_codon:yes stop_codon:yes gene_type:complete